jgi:aldose 1-epimerase
MIRNMRIEVFTLKNTKGAEVQITNFGARVISIKVPDRDGRVEDVVLGFDFLAGYENPNPYLGAVVGRYANRIARGRFTLHGTIYELATNDRGNHLHGGIKGFDKVVWTPRPFDSAQGPALELSYRSHDGEEGYPGNLEVKTIYSLTEENGLHLEFQAVTDRPTILNLANHSYFNLSGNGSTTILDHVLMIDADRFTPTDSNSIPTGELAPVENTPFDFRKPTAVGARIQEYNEQLRYGLGYDHNWVLNRKDQTRLALVATVCHPGSGRLLEVLTTQPGLQFYSGNQLDGTVLGKNDVYYRIHSGFCLETQHFPDSPNQLSFPSTTLNPGQEYHHTTVYRFSVTES